MITKNQAERIAAAVSSLRPDWPASSILTLIGNDLTAWSYQDLAIGLVYVATDQNVDGSWVSKTPARVKEQGPWRTIGMASADLEAAREKARREVAERKHEHRIRLAAISGCRMCDDQGRTLGGAVCAHDTEAAQIAKRGRLQAQAALEAVRAARKPEGNPA